MIQQIHDDIFSIAIPLPNNPLKSLNAYCIKGETRDLLIDTGFNRPECREALLQGLGQLAVKPEALDVFLTHLHADHSGLAADLVLPPESVVWADPLEAEGINNSTRREEYWSRTLPKMLPHGISPAELEELKNQHPGIRFVPSRIMDYAVARHGDELIYGKRRLTVIRTPGHTPGHLTLYEPSLKLYFSGDHILGDITPNITRWSGVKDSLGDYLASLATVSALDVSLTLPGHRSFIPDMRARIRELEKHHEIRLNEVRRILRQGDATGYAVASQMTWSLRNIAWNDFPVSQKWFAMGEALSHLDRLVALDEAKCVEREDGLAVFRLLQSLPAV